MSVEQLRHRLQAEYGVSQNSNNSTTRLHAENWWAGVKSKLKMNLEEGAGAVQHERTHHRLGGAAGMVNRETTETNVWEVRDARSHERIKVMAGTCLFNISHAFEGPVLQGLLERKAAIDRDVGKKLLPVEQGHEPDADTPPVQPRAKSFRKVRSAGTIPHSRKRSLERSYPLTSAAAPLHRLPIPPALLSRCAQADASRQQSLIRTVQMEITTVQPDHAMLHNTRMLLKEASEVLVLE
eukprot:TRINITY_DN7560_c0_g1_i1.p1 TRINITY_DN7560_c0_g1~~TRINITY_DN7560_c0_g1_i1.p1  ORF type:complete len:239 (+),score=51.14 TRINITY_DN7560_c0_g1_i1:595-1311(+)